MNLKVAKLQVAKLQATFCKLLFKLFLYHYLFIYMCFLEKEGILWNCCSNLENLYQFKNIFKILTFESSYKFSGSFKKRE